MFKIQETFTIKNKVPEIIHVKEEQKIKKAFITIGYKHTDYKKVLFHGWGKDKDGTSVGIIEFEDGNVSTCLPQNLQFIS